jgi:proteasome lid subunit RPN8/RPN11
MTWQPSETVLAAALAHAARVQPLEACGVVADGEFHAVKNNATDWDAFVMDMGEYLAIAKEKKIEAIVHSHVYGPPKPSDGDRAACEATGLPWLIVSWPTGKWQVLEPSGWKAPLVGRRWAWGTHDCFGTARDGFYEYSGIQIPDFPREWLWWENGENIIEDQFEAAGFVKVDDPVWRHCDFILMRIPPSKVINHIGLFIHPDMILHQLLGRNSVREIYGGVWQMATRLHLRHRDLLEAAPAPPANPYDWGVVRHG